MSELAIERGAPSPLDLIGIDGRPRALRFQARPSREDTDSSRPGYGITPERIYSVYRAAEMGQPAQMCDLFEDGVESDGHLHGLLSGRIEGVSGNPPMVRPSDAIEAAVVAARVLEDALTMRCNLDETIEHHLYAPFVGWSLSEVAWDFVNGWWVPVWFYNVPHRRFTFDELDEPLLTTEANRWPGERLRGTWMMSRARHRKAVRGGLLRGAMWWSTFKKMSVRDWLIFAEKFGIPVPVGIYREGASAETIASLEMAVQDIGDAGRAVMSDAASILFPSSLAARDGDTANLHPAIVALCNAEMSKLIAGATLAVETGGPGSFALGRVHENRGFSLAKRDARRIATVFRQYIGRPFHLLNGLGALRPPTLVIQVLPETDPLTDVKVASILANELGLPLDEEQLRDKTGWRPPSRPESAIRGTKTTPSTDEERPPDGPVTDE
jgi:phage gp29-like protein